MEIIVFVAIAMVLAVGIVFVTGKGLGYLYADKKPMSDEEVAEYSAHTNPIHMCRFIGSCFIAGALIATLFAIGLMINSKVLDIISICLSAAAVIAGLTIYLIVFRYKPMKARFLAAKAAEEKALAEAKAAESKKKGKKAAATEEPKPEAKKESAASKRVKAVAAVSRVNK